MRKLDPAAVKQYRETMECGIVEAKRALMREILFEAVEKAKTPKDFREILEKLVDIAA